MPSSPSPAALRDLIARVEKATGPDRRIDAEVAIAFDLCPAGSMLMGRQHDAATFATGRYALWKAPKWSASLDAATALMERVLPGWDYHLWRDNDYDSQYVAEMVCPPRSLTGDAGYFGCDGHAATRPLAILAGILEGKLALLHQSEAADA